MKTKKMKEVPIKSFRISLDVELTEEEIWPDKDGPVDPTEDDVYSRISQCGGLGEILSEWNLDREYKVKELP